MTFKELAIVQTVERSRWVRAKRCMLGALFSSRCRTETGCCCITVTSASTTWMNCSTPSSPEKASSHHSDSGSQQKFIHSFPSTSFRSLRNATHPYPPVSFLY